MSSGGDLNDFTHSIAQGFSPDYMMEWLQSSRRLQTQGIICALFGFSSVCFTSRGFQSRHVKDSHPDPPKQKHKIILCIFEIIVKTHTVFSWQSRAYFWKRTFEKRNKRIVAQKLCKDFFPSPIRPLVIFSSDCATDRSNRIVPISHITLVSKRRNLSSVWYSDLSNIFLKFISERLRGPWKFFENFPKTIFNFFWRL